MGATYSQKRTITNNLGIGTWCWLLSSLSSVLTYGVPTTKSLLPLVSKPSIHVQRVKRPHCLMRYDVFFLYTCLVFVHVPGSWRYTPGVPGIFGTPPSLLEANQMALIRMRKTQEDLKQMEHSPAGESKLYRTGLKVEEVRLIFVFWKRRHLSTGPATANGRLQISRQ